MNPSKIEWLYRLIDEKLIPGKAWNPVKGICPKPRCPWCYVVRDALRFGKLEEEISLDMKRLKVVHPQNRSIFPGCFSVDLFREDAVPALWTDMIISQIKKNAHLGNRYFFLTKYPKGLLSHTFPSCCAIGVSITGKVSWEVESGKDDLWRLKYLLSDKIENIKFISIEPFMKKVVLPDAALDQIRWIIMGGMTGPQKRSYPVDPKWIDSVINQAEKKRRKIGIFLKDNAIQYYPNLIQEVPSDRWDRFVDISRRRGKRDPIDAEDRLPLWMGNDEN